MTDTKYFLNGRWFGCNPDVCGLDDLTEHTATKEQTKIKWCPKCNSFVVAYLNETSCPLNCGGSLVVE